MQRLATLTLAAILLVLAGCGGKMDESVLPTRVPTFSAADFAVTPEPGGAATTTPLSTATPLPPNAMPAATATATVVSTVTSTATPEPTATSVPTATSTVTGTTPITATAPVTNTVPVTAAAPATATTLVTTAAPMTITGPVTNAPPVTVTGISTQAAAVAVKVLPAAIKAALAIADVTRGQQLSLSKGCIACHSLDPNQPMLGPTWRGVGQVAGTRVPEEGAELYLYNSIAHPNAYIVKGFPPNVMLPIYRETLADREIADLIAFLRTLQH